MSNDHDAGPPRGLPPVEREQDPSAWRLTFAYDGSDIRLVAQQRVAMIAPPDDSDRTYAARAGTWVEVRDASGHGLYRQILADPVRHGYEVHSDDPAEGSREVEPESPSGVFQVVVPDLPEGEDVVLHRFDEAEMASDEAAAEVRARTSEGRPAEGGAVARPVLTARLEETPPFEAS
jgi:hypothetical protein